MFLSWEEKLSFGDVEEKLPERLSYLVVCVERMLGTVNVQALRETLKWMVASFLTVTVDPC